jgi:hypothetical protein
MFTIATIEAGEKCLAQYSSSRHVPAHGCLTPRSALAGSTSVSVIVLRYQDGGPEETQGTCWGPSFTKLSH